MNTPGDLEPPKGLGFGARVWARVMGLGSGWPGPTCKAEIDHTRVLHKVLCRLFLHIHRESQRIRGCQHFRSVGVFDRETCESGTLFSNPIPNPLRERYYTKISATRYWYLVLYVDVLELKDSCLVCCHISGPAPSKSVSSEKQTKAEKNGRFFG